MRSHSVSAESPLPASVLQQIAAACSLDEISNFAGSVRRYIYWSGRRHKTTGKLQIPMLFLIYQTGRHGPQNGFRLCLVHEGFYIASEARAESELDDEIDGLERDIPQGHVEVVIFGDAPAAPNDQGHDGGDEEKEMEEGTC